MSIQAGVGKSRHRKAATAGRDAATAAMNQMGEDRADLVVVFATSEYEQQELLDSIREVTGDVPLVGCSGEGVITRDSADESAHAVAVMAVKSDTARFATLSVPEFSKGGELVASKLIEQLRERDITNVKALLLFPDGLSGNTTTLLDELATTLPFPVTIAGGTAGDMMKLEKTYQYCGSDVMSDAVSALVIGGNVTVDVDVSHGCAPIGLEMAVTRAEGGMVYEIDGRPAWEVFREYLDGDPQDLMAEDVVHLCVGQRVLGEQNDFVVRTPLQLDKETGGLFFPGSLSPDVPVQMTRRDPERIRNSAIDMAKSMLGRHDNKPPGLVFHFDCAGRGQIIFGTQATQMAVSPMQEVLGAETPWIGFHTFGEIAPAGDRPYYRNYSVVLCSVYED